MQPAASVKCKNKRQMLAICLMTCRRIQSQWVRNRVWVLGDQFWWSSILGSCQWSVCAEWPPCACQWWSN